MKNFEYYLYRFVKDFVPIYPIYLLLFESKGLSLAQISLLLVIWCIPSLLLEIPTGVLADYWSRRNMLVIGSICKAACYGFWLFSEGFVFFAVGFIFWGISESFCSGSEEALLYDSLKEKGLEKSFDRILGKGHYYSNIGIALSCASGGFFAATIGMGSTLLISVFSGLFCAVIALRFREVNFFKHNYKTESVLRIKQYLGTLTSATGFCLTNHGLLITILLLILVVGMAGILDEYDQLVAKGFGLDLGFIGVWVGIRYLLEAIGGRIAYRFKTIMAWLRVKDSFVITFVLCLIGGIFLGLSVYWQDDAHGLLLIPLYGAFYLLMSSARVIHEDTIHQQIENEGRSTIHSVVSLTYSLYGMLFFGLLSIVASSFSLRRTIIIVALYIIITSLVLQIFYRRSARAQKERAAF